MGLNLFPARVPIGTAELNNQRVAVLMTPEFARALSDLFERVGGPSGMSNNDLAVLESFNETNPLAELAQQVAEMRQQLDLLTQPPAPTTYGPDFEINYLFEPMRQADTGGADVESLFESHPVDWEHPGALGAQTPNTGAFTRVRIEAGTAALPALYFATDTTTGLYRPSAGAVGLSVAGATVVTLSATGAAFTQNVSTTAKVIADGGLTTGIATALITSSIAMNNGAAAAGGTLLNAPAVGNPTKWIPINDNGTTRYIPSW